MEKTIALSITVLLLLSLLFMVSCKSQDPGDDARGSGDSQPLESEVSPPQELEHVTARDADAYFEANSQVISVKPAKDSDAVFTESEITENLLERGFGDYPITSDYSMDGEYFEATEISGMSSDKHPTYRTFFISEAEDYWTIFVVDGFVVAIPVSYNLQSELDVQVVLSESATVMSYDSVTNKFFETIPNESELIVKTVDRINAETLEKLDMEAIDNL